MKWYGRQLLLRSTLYAEQGHTSEKDSEILHGIVNVNASLRMIYFMNMLVEVSAAWVVAWMRKAAAFYILAI